MQSLPFDIACFCKTGQHASDEQSEWTVSLSLCSGILSEFGLRVRNVEFNLWLWGGHRLRIAFSSIAICGLDAEWITLALRDTLTTHVCTHAVNDRMYMCGYIVDRWIGVAFWSGGHRYSLAMMRINGYDSLLVDSHSWIRTQTVIVIALEYVCWSAPHNATHSIYSPFEIAFKMSVCFNRHIYRPHPRPLTTAHWNDSHCWRLVDFKTRWRASNSFCIETAFRRPTHEASRTNMITVVESWCASFTNYGTRISAFRSGDKSINVRRKCGRRNCLLNRVIGDFNHEMDMCGMNLIIVIKFLLLWVNIFSGIFSLLFIIEWMEIQCLKTLHTILWLISFF